ncbi:hypothetical protein EYY60_02805 [Flavobacterium zhairuonense]|uniref:hypothetical protein n=1 Tax=Flavobacterium zhairuonense TaxID=2493631 RepID=UPI00104C8AC7|nr:hypothetical protein [Flavobacterium zhairuonense]KAF2515005.1 hypothetical protein EYY60_02805 [Flavobacterium zhairuonense]
MKNIALLLSFFIIQQTFSQNTFPPTGNVGIGTTTPDAKLNVVGNINIDNVDWTTDNELRIREGGSNTYGAFFKYGLNDILAIGTRNADLDYDAIQISRGSLNTVFKGNVGIGISTPTTKLQVLHSLTNDSNEVIASLTRFGTTNGGSSIVRIGYHDTCDFEVNSGYSYYGHRFGSYFDLNIINNKTGGDHGAINFITNASVKMAIKANGNIGIGVSAPQNKLDVNGTIHSKEVKVDMNGWSDFVFKRDYDLPTLQEVEKHITEKGHLENIPSEEEVLKNGINLGEMNSKLLQKIEELTLYMIELKKENLEMKERLTTLENK